MRREELHGRVERQQFSLETSEQAAGQAMKKAYSWLMIQSNILFDLFERFYDLMECSWNCATCATSSPWPRNCTSAVPPRCWASRNRR
ncbi:hypothetical protein EMIT0P12_40278 [Pseudomonas sp. IT-P12]